MSHLIQLSVHLDDECVIKQIVIESNTTGIPSDKGLLKSISESIRRESDLDNLVKDLITKPK